MTRRQLTIVAGILVLATGIGFVAMRAKGPVRDTTGTIGAAQRYHSDQIAEGDVQLTDAQVQAFLQSDTFHKIATNPEFRKAVTSGEFAKAVQVQGTGLIFQDTRLIALLKSDTFQRFESDAGLSQLAASDAFAQFAADAQRDPSLMDAMKTIVGDDHAKSIVAETGLVTLLKSDVARQTLQSDGFAKVIDSGALQRLSQSDVFEKLMADVAKLGTTDAGLQNLIEANHQYTELSRSTDYALLVKDGLGKLIDGGFAKIYTTGDVGARITDYQAMVKDAPALAAIASDAFSHYLADVAKTTTDTGLQIDMAKELLANDAFEKFVTDGGLHKLVTDTGFVTALQNDAVQHALTDANVRTVITGGDFQKLVDNPDFLNLVSKPEFLATVRDGSLEKAVESAE